MNQLNAAAQDEEFTAWDNLMLLINLAALIVSSFKILTLLRMYKQIASLIELLSNAFKDIIAFLINFFIFILIISACYRCLGAIFDNNPEEKEYPYLS